MLNAFKISFSGANLRVNAALLARSLFEKEAVVLIIHLFFFTRLKRENEAEWNPNAVPNPISESNTF